MVIADYSCEPDEHTSIWVEQLCHTDLLPYHIGLKRTAAIGTLYPKDGQISKEQGRLVAKFGPIKNWSISAAADSYLVLLSCPPPVQLVYMDSMGCICHNMLDHVFVRDSQRAWQD